MNQHATEHLSAYVDGDLDEGARAEVERHLRTCASCAAELDGLRRLVAYAGTVPSRDAAPVHDLWPGIESRIGRVVRT